MQRKRILLTLIIIRVAMAWNDQLISNLYTKSRKEFADQNEKSSEGNWKN